MHEQGDAMLSHIAVPDDGSERLAAKLRADIIGEGAVIESPFGPRRLVYADHAASGRALDCVERHIREQVLPFYANTHTDSSFTGARTGRLREEARGLIRDIAEAGPQYAVIFCGSGSTAAIEKMLAILNLRLPTELDHRYGLVDHVPLGERPVVFVGPYEHHSNELLWRESIAEVVVISQDACGLIDTTHLEEELRRFAHRPMRIGCFAAASNVTGLISNIDGITSLLHTHGALAFWDYASAAPHLPIRMESRTTNGAIDLMRSKDAAFVSPHKFPGGPGTPGILIVKRELLRTRVPTCPGGGTVRFASPQSQSYISDEEAREEAGTPAIVGSIRAGLVAFLQRAVGMSYIRSRERAISQTLLQRLGNRPGLRLLGSTTVDRLPIFSFLLTGPLEWRVRLLHHNFVVASLNDLFGIQARGGCSCAGPYAHRLLKIGADQSARLESQVLNGLDILEPGWTRISLDYTASDTIVDYVASSINLLADWGWKLLRDYNVDVSTGLWRYRDACDVAHEFSWNALGSCSGEGHAQSRRGIENENLLVDHLNEARRILSSPLPPGLQESPIAWPGDAEALRWFAPPFNTSGPGVPSQHPDGTT